MTRRGFLAWSSALGAATLLGRRARAGAPQNLVVVWSAGGWDPTFVFDPHFEDEPISNDPDSAPASANGIDFAHADTRPSVARFFERYGDQAAVINGLAVGSISHEGCTRLLLTGGRGQGRPDVGTAVASEAGADLLLPHLVLSGPRYPGALGSLVVPLNATLAGVCTDALPAGVSVDAEAEERARAWLLEEAGRLGASDRARLGAWRDSLDTFPALSALLTELNPAEDPTDEALISLAVEAMRADACRSLTLALSPPNQTTWDSHYENNANQDRAFEQLFDHLLTLLDGLQGASLLDRTLVLVLSEMGRSPVPNAAAGKDHWPYTSALLVGAGVSGGQVIGATDTSMVGSRINLETGALDEAGERPGPANLLASVVEAFDGDPSGLWGEAAPLSAWRA